jgi:hypothetical protein
MRLRTPLLIGAALAGAAALTYAIIPAASRLRVTSDTVHFPTVSGQNLDRQEFEFPRDFAGDLNILFVPFQQRHQLVVNTWVPFAQDVEATFPGVIYYELPTINEMPGLSRMFINEGMRAGIPDQTARERTVTLYLDTAAFRRATAIPDTSQVHILLVDRAGEILWRTTGDYSPAKGDEMLDAIAAARG